MKSASQFIFGKISFRAQDGFSNIFLENCRKSKILLYDLKAADNGLSGWIQNTDIAKLYEAAEKSGMKIEITKRFGLPDIIRKYRHRFGIPLGLFLFFIIIAILNSMIWSVEIKGIETIDETELLSQLCEAGLEKGASTSLNTKDIEYRLYKAFSDISWVNVQIIGSRAYINISEIKKEAVEEKENIYSNITAKKDGEVIRAEIFSGEGKIYPGTAVVKGDLLVSGVKTYRDGRVELVDSNAEIYARTKNYIESPLNDKITVKKQSYCKNNYILNFFGINIPLTFNVKQSNFTINSYLLDCRDLVFPIGIIREHHYSFCDDIVNLSSDQKFLLAFRDFSFSALRLFSSAEIKESSITIPENLTGAIEGKFNCIEDIALKKKFTVAES